MSLGGIAILDEVGRIIYIDRPPFKPASHFTGKACWDFVANADEAQKLQQSFATAVTFGTPINLAVCSGQSLLTAVFRLNLQRIQGTRDIAVRFAHHEPDTLTDTERLVAQLIAADLKPREICEHMNFSLWTFETHRSRILRKLKVNGIAGITLWCAEQERWSLIVR